MRCPAPLHLLADPFAMTRGREISQGSENQRALLSRLIELSCTNRDRIKNLFPKLRGTALACIISGKAKIMNTQKTFDDAETTHRAEDTWRPWVACPLIDGLARIGVDTCVEQFGSSSIRFFEITDCSLWPEKGDCGRQCIRTCEELVER